jgi:hypothetical protein
MTPTDILGPAMAEAIRAIVREELEAARDAGPAAVELLSPGEASERLGGRPSADTIVAWVKAGRLPLRTNNTAAAPRRINYLVRLEEVRQATAPATAEAPADKPTSIEDARARGAARGLRARPGGHT